MGQHKYFTLFLLILFFPICYAQEITHTINPHKAKGLFNEVYPYSDGYITVNTLGKNKRNIAYFQSNGDLKWERTVIATNSNYHILTSASSAFFVDLSFSPGQFEKKDNETPIKITRIDQSGNLNSSENKLNGLLDRFPEKSRLKIQEIFALEDELYLLLESSFNGNLSYSLIKLSNNFKPTIKQLDPSTTIVSKKGVEIGEPRIISFDNQTIRLIQITSDNGYRFSCYDYSTTNLELTNSFKDIELEGMQASNPVGHKSQIGIRSDFKQLNDWSYTERIGNTVQTYFTLNSYFDTEVQGKTVHIFSSTWKMNQATSVFLFQTDFSNSQLYSISKDLGNTFNEKHYLSFIDNTPYLSIGSICVFDPYNQKTVSLDEFTAEEKCKLYATYDNFDRDLYRYSYILRNTEGKLIKFSYSFSKELNIESCE